MNRAPMEIPIAELARLRAAGRDVRVIDIRSAEEYAAGHVDGARHLPGEALQTHLDALRGAELVVTVCGKGGGRSTDAAVALRALGVPARFLEGGTLAWQAAHRRGP